MSKFVWYLTVGLVALATQATVRHFGVPEPFIPQLMAIIVVSLAFSEANVFGCCMSFMLGLCADLASATLIGPWAGSFVVVFGALAMLSQRLFIESTAASIVISFISVIGIDLLYSAMGAEYPIFTWELPQRFLGQAVVTAVVAPSFLSFLTKRGRGRTVGLIGRGSVRTAG